MPSPLIDDDRLTRRRPGTVRWRDEARFIRTWLENPRTTGAVSPSSRALSRAIAREVDPGVPGSIVELGPGTGPVTEALIRRGVAPERLILVEYEAGFCKLLARRFPQCRIIQGDAYALGETLWPVLVDPAAAIVSSLPLLNRPDSERLALLGDAFALMRPGAPFVQFTYGMTSPIPRHNAAPPFSARASAPVWLNLPPARVWTYRAYTAQAASAGERLDLLDKLRLRGERIGDEWREHRERLRAEWLARSAEAKAGWRARTQKVKTGLAERGARLKALKEERETRVRVDWTTRHTRKDRH